MIDPFSAGPVSDEVPSWLWRVGAGTLIGAVIFATTLLALALAGVSDPRPVGDPAIDKEPAVAFSVREPQPATRRSVGAACTVEPPATVEIIARQVSGPSEAGYGLWLGNSPDDALIIALNSNGYFAVYTTQGGNVRFMEDWQHFPHIRQQGEVNRLRVDLLDGQIVVRINDELAAGFDDSTGMTAASRLQVGFLVETFDTGGTEATFERIRIWQGR